MTENWLISVEIANNAEPASNASNISILPLQPSTPKARRLGRDDRLLILGLHRLEFSMSQIAEKVSLITGRPVTKRAVQYAIQGGHPTPQHIKAGRPPTLTESEVNRLEEFVTATKRGRQMPYAQLAFVVFGGLRCNEYAIRNALEKRGYSRCRARVKPFLSPESRVKRLAWATEHRNWTIDQWKTILWSDETWVTGGRGQRVWVTRKANEELTEECVKTKKARPRGWMFWGCFHGFEKGIGIFWEKDWGTITAESYQRHIIPKIHDYVNQRFITNGEMLKFMQDNAPGHAARSTLADLVRRAIRPIIWPANSPDLNPIEAIWCEMKIWLTDRYGDSECKPTELRRRVEEAWNALETETFRILLESMPARCQAVIDAEGGYTRF